MTHLLQKEGISLRKVSFVFPFPVHCVKHQHWDFSFAILQVYPLLRVFFMEKAVGLTRA